MKIRNKRAEDHLRIYEIHQAAFGQPAEGDIVNALRADERSYRWWPLPDLWS